VLTYNELAIISKNRFGFSVFMSIIELPMRQKNIGRYKQIEIDEMLMIYVLKNFLL
jgi:hypothetical protein